MQSSQDHFCFIVGDWWEISVFTRFSTSDPGSSAYKPATGTTVVILYSTESGNPNEFELTVDENGKTTFQFIQEISDIAFQAFSPEFYQSNKIILSEKYVSFSEVDQLFSLSIITSLGSLLGTGWVIKKEKIWRWQKLFLIFFISLFSFITVFSTYSRHFMPTIWGCPDSIIGDIITLTILKMLYLLGLVFLTLVVMIFIFLYNPSDQESESSITK